MPSIENQNSDTVDPEQNRFTPEIRQTMGLVQSQLAQLLQQRAAVVKRIAMIRRAIVGLNAIFSYGETGQVEIAKYSIPKSDRCTSDSPSEVRKTAHLA